MAALRWILLLVGIVFLVVLATWEMRRSRHARDGSAGPGHEEPELGHLPDEFPSQPHPMSAAGLAGRTRTMVPPLVEWPPVTQPEPLSELHSKPLPEADAIVEAFAGESAAMFVDTPPLTSQYEPVSGASEPEVTEPGTSESDISESGISEPSPSESSASESAADLGAAKPAPLPQGSPAALVVDWPPEGQRHIIALRIIDASEQKLSGRATRLALAACGFVHGRYRIFHQPSTDGRALLSCASLSPPGHFDPNSMDFQHFAGLSLFAVLPGPLPPVSTLECLLETASDLTLRLRARLQDDQGRPLDAARVESLRASARDLPVDVLGAEPTA